MMRLLPKKLTWAIALMAIALIGCTDDQEEELETLVEQSLQTNVPNNESGFIDYDLHLFNVSHGITEANNKNVNQVISVPSSHYNTDDDQFK